MNSIADWLTMHIKNNVSDLTELQLIKIKFGLECLLSEASKTVIYILFFSLFSLATEFLVSFLFFTVIRAFAGGHHEETYWRCFITSFILLGACILIGISLNITIHVKIAILIVSVIIAYLFSPVDHPNKPIISQQRRRRLKYLSIGVIIVLGLIGIKLPGVYSNIGLLAILVESISLILGFMKKKYVYKYNISCNN